MYQRLLPLVALVLFAAAPLAPAEQNESLPATLKPSGQTRCPYDWAARHEAVKQYNAAHRPEYVIIGDSITHHWGGNPTLGCRHWNEPAWQRLFGTHAVTNMGFGFDYIDNAYHRVAEGELDGCAPRVIILLLGTNNLGHRHDMPEVCGENMKALLSLLRRKAPSSKILLLGVLPRREPKLAERIAATNKLYRGLADNRKIFFLDLTEALALPAAEGQAPLADPAFMRDGVHPNAHGYDALVPRLKKALKRLDPRF